MIILSISCCIRPMCRDLFDQFPCLYMTVLTYISDTASDNLRNLTLSAQHTDALLFLFCESPQSNLTNHDLEHRTSLVKTYTRNDFLLNVFCVFSCIEYAIIGKKDMTPYLVCTTAQFLVFNLNTYHKRRNAEAERVYDLMGNVSTVGKILVGITVGAVRDRAIIAGE